MRAHEIDYQIKGENLQIVEIELDPEEVVFAEAGAMIYMDSDIEMETKFGKKEDNGFFSSLVSAASNFIVGESIFTTYFTNKSKTKKRKITFASPVPGNIIPLDLKEHPNGIISQKDSFLASAYGNNVSVHFNQRISTGFFGGEGFIMQKIEGDGIAFINASGHCEVIDLNNETIFVDTGCLVAFEPSISFEIQRQKGIKNMLFGGEGLFLAKLSGKGSVVIQSMPLSKLANLIYTNAPSHKSSSTIENNGLLNGIFDSDR